MPNHLSLTPALGPLDDLEDALSWQHVLFPGGRPTTPTSSSLKSGDGLSTADHSEDESELPSALLSRPSDEDELEVVGRLVEEKFISLPSNFKLEAKHVSLAIRCAGPEGLLLRSLEEALQKYGASLDVE